MIERILAMMTKELRQMRRDRLTIGMMFAIPIVQLMLFGFAINSDPRHLPLAVEYNDHSQLTRSIDAALRNSTFFEVTRIAGPGEADGGRTPAACGTSLHPAHAGPPRRSLAPRLARPQPSARPRHFLGLRPRSSPLKEASPRLSP